METGQLFSEQNENHLPPLAVRMRPRTAEEHLGQEHLTGDRQFLRAGLEGGRLYSLVLWGPPGSGKTSLARLLASRKDTEFYELSAVSASVKDVRDIIQKARSHQHLGRQTLLFLDEIHRFNKAQQDALLPAVESGHIILVGATTENPSFHVISPLLSRCRVLRLKALGYPFLQQILQRSLQSDILLSRFQVDLSDSDRDFLIESAGGDARKMLNTLDIAFNTVQSSDPAADRIVISREAITAALQEKKLLYDRAGDYHYDTISAFIKSVRGSDPDAAIYWLAVMLEGGEDPVFIARRLIILASEDIGNAEPFALVLAVSTLQAVQAIGMPEAMIPLSQATAYLSAAPKSNAAYMAVRKASENVREKGAASIPMHLRNAPTELMRNEGYGLGYRYPHDEGGYSDQNYLPEDRETDAPFYRPISNGYEKFIAQRLKSLRPRRYEK